MKKWKDENGQVLVVVALSMTVLIGFIGFATDVGLLLRERRIAQSVADSAAVGGATEALNEGTPSSMTTGMYKAAALDASLKRLYRRILERCRKYFDWRNAYPRHRFQHFDFRF